MLLDHCVPKRFRRLLVGHEVRTTYEMGWTDLSNGELLRRAAEGPAPFDVLITVDQRIQYQQNLLSLPLSVIILVAPDSRFATLQPLAPLVLQVLPQMTAPTLVRIDLSRKIEVVIAAPRNDTPIGGTASEG